MEVGLFPSLFSTAIALIGALIALFVIVVGVIGFIQPLIWEKKFVSSLGLIESIQHIENESRWRVWIKFQDADDVLTRSSYLTNKPPESVGKQVRVFYNPHDKENIKVLAAGETKFRPEFLIGPALAIVFIVAVFYQILIRR